jgi:hypothetical protein
VPVIQRLAPVTRRVELRCAASIARYATHHMVETNGRPVLGSATRLCSDFRASASSGRGVLRPAAMATAANTAHGYMPWPLAARASTTTRPAAGVRAASAPRAWTGRPPPPVARRAVAAKAGAAEVRPSSSPDAVTYTASISTDAPLYEPPGVSQRRGDGID